MASAAVLGMGDDEVDRIVTRLLTVATAAAPRLRCCGAVTWMAWGVRRRRSRASGSVGRNNLVDPSRGRCVRRSLSWWVRPEGGDSPRIERRRYNCARRREKGARAE